MTQQDLKGSHWKWIGIAVFSPQCRIWSEPTLTAERGMGGLCSFLWYRWQKWSNWSTNEATLYNYRWGGTYTRANEMTRCVPFYLCVLTECVGRVSLGRSSLHTLIGLLHFPSTDQWLSHSAETWAWINCHTLADYLPRMLFCAGRMFEMPVTDTLHPPPPTLTHTHTHTQFLQCAIEQ